MLILFILSQLAVTGQSESSSLFRQARRCCSSLRVSSPSLAGDAQADKMGLYTRVGAMNGRHVYRHVARHVYLYYYDWDGRGTNWMLGPEAGGQSRGVQSINLQGRALAAQWCPEDMHQARVMYSPLVFSFREQIVFSFTGKSTTAEGGGWATRG